MFGYPSVSWDKKMFAIIPDSAQVIELAQVENVKMDELQKTDIQAIPTFFSPDGRHWPNKLSGIIMAREI